MQRAVLIADENRLLLDAVRREARAASFELAACANGDEAIGLLRSRDFEVVLLDGEMLERRGLDAITVLRARRPMDLRVVLVMTHRTDDSTRFDPAVVHAVLGKPVDARAMVDLIGNIFDEWSAAASTA